MKTDAVMRVTHIINMILVPMRGDTHRGIGVAERKNKMSVLNAVKNKLLARVVVVVNKQKKYVRKAA